MSEMDIQDETFLKCINDNKDCPEKIFKMAKTPWQKQVAVEFFNNEKCHKLIEQKLSWHDKLLYGILGVTVFSVLTYIVTNLFEIFT